MRSIEKRFPDIARPGLLASLFFLLVLLPYVSPYPIQSDIQPVVFLVGGSLIFLALICRRMRCFDGTDSLFLLFALLSLVYIPSNGSLDLHVLRKGVGLLFAFIIYFVSKYSVPAFRSRTLSFACAIYLVVAVIQLAWPGVYDVAIPGHVITANRGGLVYGRGINALCPEPGFLGFIAIAFLLLLGCFADRGEHIPRQRRWFIVGTSIFLLVASKSGTGYAAGALIFVLYFFQRRGIIAAVKMLPVCVACLLLYHAYGTGRGQAILDIALTHPERLLMDASIMLRVVQILVGFLAVWEYPLGSGDIWFGPTAHQIMEKYNLLSIVHGTVAQNYVNQEMHGVGVSAFGVYSVRFGVLIYFFVGMILWTCRSSKRYAMYVAFFVVAFMASVPILYPPLWFLMGWQAGLRRQRLTETARNQSYGLKVMASGNVSPPVKGGTDRVPVEDPRKDNLLSSFSDWRLLGFPIIRRKRNSQ